ncbi:DUF5655 domain-containing protein [Mucilaginibacter galii]|uniref:DUF5655 domain-containing protein n=1 Tax=Mucilaginibacter galii TaxID=2005073 RepID=A0A917J4G7_9SPHI|nr:DUF5655 domain-containing protein [Mucilaginibacter galii]GGI48970.1 hypothetical protein GCM10011425_01820 [Mucilaginibacter galii]
MQYSANPADDIGIKAFLNGKSAYTLALFHHFIEEYQTIGNVVPHPTKTMIALGNPDKRIAWVTQLGKNFIHIVFPFKQLYPDNLCFKKMAQVPGSNQFNHHFRMCYVEDVNEEVLAFMKLAYYGEQ